MKTRWLKKFTKTAQDIRLTAGEKRVMLREILGPVGIPSPYSFFLAVLEHQQKILVAAFTFAFILTSTGTSFAATNALPGDVLYAVKVNINEEIQNFVTVNANAKAKLGIKRTDMRLAEAEELSKQGRLNAETQAIIETNIEKHTEGIKENLATLAATSDEGAETAKEVLSDLKNSFEAREASLSTIASSSASSTDEHIVVDALLSKVKEVQSEMNTIEENIDKQVEQDAEDLPSTPAATSTSVVPSTTASSTATTTTSIITPTSTPSIRPDIL